MKAENCGRYAFELGGETFDYSVLRKYVCNRCGGAVTHTFLGGVDRIACARCGGEDIISEYRYDKQVSDAMELKGSPLYQHHMGQVQARKESGMPLKDIEPRGRLKRVETIRLGWQEKSQSSGRDYPVASDHFVLIDAPTLAEVYTEPPKSLPIYFPYRTFDENVEASYGVWVGGRKDAQGKTKGGFRVCQGDGEFVQSALPFQVSHRKNGGVRVNRAKGPRLVSWGKVATDFKWGDHAFQEGDQVPCPGRARNLYDHCEACNPNILVKVRVRDARVARFGYWQIATGSINNYLHFMSVWDELTMLPDGTRVPLPMSEVPFVISIEPGTSLYQDQRDQSWGTREAYFLKLELDPKVAQLEQSYREQRGVALLGGRSYDAPMNLLPPSPEEELPFDDPPIEEGVYDEVPEDDPFLREGDYRGAAPNGDAVEEVQEAMEQEAVEYVPAPPGLGHENIAKLAAEMLPYENPGEVMQALLEVIGNGWNRSTEWSPSDAWAQLQDHKRAPTE